ncbi:hypothetical protein CEQ21_04785 [Niallia circulans]|uniref:Uncharacterized protein n=1 Tax=Niallia circulans TaxID=1397 RepID=A0A553STC3_NIACI|nr:hypothetical protein [Niallia circulans]TRZ40255.1 hypothetical protein CEQ21_04785 [Niallia circulans]
MKFFKKMNEKQKVNTKKAAEITCVFYMISLLIHSTFIFISTGKLLSSSFYILIAGLIVFFCSEVIFNKKG